MFVFGKVVRYWNSQCTVYGILNSEILFFVTISNYIFRHAIYFQKSRWTIWTMWNNAKSSSDLLEMGRDATTNRTQWIICTYKQWVWLTSIFVIILNFYEYYDLVLFYLSLTLPLTLTLYSLRPNIIYQACFIWMLMLSTIFLK